MFACTACKILETVIATDLLEFLSSHKLLSKQQHGFLKKHSTVTNLLESVNDWTISCINKKSVVIGYVDFQRAFDVISHKKLIHKLNSYGISGNLLYWINAFISNRMQCVRISNTLSTWLPVSSGVPLGFVLGPLLFNLFINDICDKFTPNISAKLFADDVKIYTEITDFNSQQAFQTHLDIIQKWSILWQLPISYSKCNILIVNEIKNNKDQYIFNSTPICKY
ncbi:MAG: reverse transcriptase family protein [Oscillospiraceae bacterium]